MGRSQKVTYNPPPPDNTFAQYLQYTKDQESKLEQRAAQERAEAAAAANARRASGSSAYAGLKASTKAQLDQGLIGYESAANQLRDYAAKYDITPPEEDINELTQQYLAKLPGQRATGISAVYEELLGRQATPEELSKGQERFQQGYYGSMTDFKDSLTKSPEYQKKFNQSYLDNYYDTMFGKQTVDEKGDKTGQRTFKFDSNLLPQYKGDLADRTKVQTPDFGKEVTGTPFELQEQVQNIRDTRQYVFSAGLTNLQGEIDKETQKLKNEGTEKVAKIGSAGALYSNLVSGFWS